MPKLPSTSSSTPQKALSSLMQDRPSHDQTHALLVSLSHDRAHVHLGPLPVLYDTFLHGSVDACRPTPPRSIAGGDADQESEAEIKLGGCVDRELELGPSLLAMPSSLQPQGGVPGSLGCQAAWGRGCGWTRESAKLPLLCSSTGHLPRALLPSLKSQLAF